MRNKLKDNTNYFREEIQKLGFDISGDTHSIVPVMLYDAKLAKDMADRLLELGIYCIGFSYPVVPMEKARIRLQISASHSREDLDQAIAAFAKVKKEFDV